MTRISTAPHNLERLHTTNKTGGYTTVTGLLTSTDLDALGGAGFKLIGGYRGITSIQFIGVGNDNGSIEATIYGVEAYGPPGERGDGIGPLYKVDALAVITCTLSTIVGDAAGYVLDTERVADTISVTPSSYLTFISSVFGVDAQTYSPADNTSPARYALPDMSNLYGVFIDFNQTGATGVTSANALISLGT